MAGAAVILVSTPATSCGPAESGPADLFALSPTMKDSSGKTDTKGSNPLSNWHVERDGKQILLSDIYPTYDWVNDDGCNKMGDWIEAAAKKAGR